MPYTSAQISGMIGGQMAMFSNQAAFSQQIGGQIGTSPMMGGGGMQNPFPVPHPGSQIAGGFAALPGAAATGLQIGGGLMGGAAGWLDPFTAGARGFAAGTGASGFMGGLSNIGTAFAQGGLRAGIGAMGAGIGGAAIAAAPAMALGAAAQYAGGQMYQGVQNIGDVRAMSGYFGSQFGQPGSWGGGMSHQTIRKITGALHELVGDDMRTTMEEIKTVMDQAGRMGMLTGITDAQTFKQRFGGIVKQVRQIADIMGTTLQEAAPMLGQMGQMGLWTSADIMGTAVAGRVAGPNAGAMMGAMGQGAQVSHAMGGTLRAGAMMGREAFMDVQAAQRAGVLSNRDIMEYTGGVGGAQGMQMMAGGIQRMMSQFGQTSAGRLMMAGLGARGETGEFTGEIDRGRLQEFLSGGISVQGLQRLGRQNLTRGNQASFFDVQEELGQNIGAQGGIGAMSQITEQVLSRFGGNQKLKQQLMRQMFGLSNRDAKLMKKLFQDAGKIRDQQERSAEDAINQAFEELERKQYRSWEGLTGAVTGAWREGVSRPLQEAGERLASDFGETWDRTVGTLTGRTRRIAMGQGERGRLIRGGALTRNYSNIMAEMAPMGQAFGQGAPMENLIRGIRNEGLGQLGAGIAGAAVTGGLSLIAGAAMTGTEGVPFFGGITQKQADLQRIGIKPGASDAEIRQGIGRAFARAESPLKLKTDKDKVEKVKAGMKRLIGQEYNEITQLRKKDPKNYATILLQKMELDPTDPDNLDALARAQAEEGYNESIRADFKSLSAAVGNIPTTPEELAKYQNAQLADVASGISAGKGLLSAGLAVVTGGASLLWAAKEYRGLDREEDIQKALTGRGSGIVQQYLEGGIERGEALHQLSTMGEEGDAAAKLIASGKADEKKESIQKFMAARGLQALKTALPKMQEVAARGPTKVQLGRGSEGLEKEFGAIVGLYRGGENTILDEGEAEEARKRALALGQKLTTSTQIQAMRRGGFIGRQIAAIADVTRFKGGDEAATEQLLGKLSSTGFDVKQLAGEDKRMKKLLEGGISKEEAEEFGKKAADVISKSLGETTEAKKTYNEKLMEMLKEYGTVHEKFVRAVDTAIDLKDPGDAPSADNPTSTEGSGGLLGLLGL